MATGQFRGSVTFVVPFAGGLVRGGLEIQAEKTRGALERAGIGVDVLTPETRSTGDLVHFFGAFDYYATLAAELGRRSIPYVCSPVFLPKQTGAKLTLASYRKRILNQNYPRGQRRLFRGASALITLSSAEDANLAAFFGPKLPPIFHAPNGIDERFFKGDPVLCRKTFGLDKPFVLCTGRIEARKNQLALIEAVRSTQIPLVIVGAATEPDYAEACRQRATANVRILDDLPFESELLPSLYAAAHTFALPSHMEVLSLSALEAAAAGANLVLSDTWGAAEHFGDQAVYVKPTSPSSIRSGIEHAFSEPRPGERQADYYQKRYSWDAVAGSLVEVYSRVAAQAHAEPAPVASS